jgi:hypothetical protein
VSIPTSIVTVPSVKGRPWLQTARGLAWCADAPEAFPYDIREFAHSLAHLSRFVGHGLWDYSVAHHSVLVAREVERMAVAGPFAQRDHVVLQALCRAALLHDAAEAFWGDMAAPVKRLPELAGYRALISRTEAAIAAHFDLSPWRLHAAIQYADLRLLATEKRDVLGPSSHDDDWGVDLPPPRAEVIAPLSIGTARQSFVDAWVSFGGSL